MTVLITGATGYLGGILLDHALQQGLRVRGLCRVKPEEPNPDVEWAQGDLLDPDSLRKAMQGCEAVIHAAALVSIWRRNRDDFARINVEGTENVLRAAREAKVERIVYTSSFFALGPTTEKPADETWWNEQEPPTLYARSKRKAALHVREAIRQGMDVIPLYPVLIYGPGKATQGNHITQMVDQYCKKKIPGVLGEGDKRWTFSYVDDVARGHLFALEKGIKGEGYILGGQDATLIEFLEMLQDLTDIPRPRMEIPFVLAKGIAVYEETRARLSQNYIPKLTREVVDVYKHHWRFSSQKAMSQLGYTRTPLKAGLFNILRDLGHVKDERSTIL